MRTIRELPHTWRLPADPTTRPPCGVSHILEPGAREVVPVRTRGGLTQLTGKEGDDLLAALVDPSAVTGEDLTTYRGPDTWAPLLERARVVGAEELVRRGIPRRTAFYMLAGRPPGKETAALVGAVLEEAEAPLVVDEDAWRPCPRSGCSYQVRGRKRWCSPACRKAVQRARDRLDLHVLGAMRCRRCGAVRYGDKSGPCPACRGKGVVEVATVTCPSCGVDRVGDATGPCPFCGEQVAP